MGYILVVGLILWLIGVLSLWQVFYKAGYEGWKSIIPIYNAYILTKIGGQPTWVFVLLFIPIVNIVGHLLTSLGVAKAFGQEQWFGVVLFLFGYFGYMYLGWGQAEYSAVETEHTN
jgi:hypothetical protein